MNNNEHEKQNELDNDIVAESRLVTERRQKLNALRASRTTAYPNNISPTHTAEKIHKQFDKADEDTLNAAGTFAIAGRMMAVRVMGKVSFVQVQDGSGERIQVYIAQDDLTKDNYNEFKTWDRGDIIYAKGGLFRTKTGEITIRANHIDIIVKSLRPLPEKFHGLTDQEARYRQRYVDLMINRDSRDVFVARSKIISYIRDFFKNRDYLEVETPMMHPIPGGASAKPFITHHNALDMTLYLRIAPELYLKRLVVGGFEKVFEINRNFRNEGVSARHNPEFTMIEFYQTYSNYQDLMDISEELLRGVATEITGSAEFTYQGTTIDFAKPFDRLSMKDSLKKYTPEYNDIIDNKEELIKLLSSKYQINVQQDMPLDSLQTLLFEEAVEHLLIQPTFIIDYPAVISPLSRRKDNDPEVAERFELFIGGREIANGFSELNDPEDQAERFKAQAAAKDAGDDEAMHYDGDYVRALEYGMPPTAGEGIGIDRLVMLLTDSASIRDVLLFPLLRPE